MTAKRLMCLALAGIIQISPVLSREAQKNILVLFSHQYDLPFTVDFQSGLFEGRDAAENQFNLYFESLDSARLHNTITDEQWAGFLQNKYGDIHFDGLIAESFKASALANESLGYLGDIPRAFYTDSELPQRKNTLYLESQSRKSAVETLKLALAQNPGCREIVIIDGRDDESQVFVEMIRDGLKNREDIQTRVLPVETREEMIQTVRGFSQGTVIFYTLVFTDQTGRKFVPREVLQELTDISRVPVYSFWDSLLNTGLVGGTLIDGRTTGKELIRAIDDFISFGSFKDDYSTLKRVLDWKSLKKYRLPVSDHSFAVINMPVSLFERYSVQVLTIFLLLFLVFSVMALLWIRAVSDGHRKLQEAYGQIETARVEAENLARRDPLTGLLNRRAVTPILNYEINRKKRLHNAVSLIILDIDLFKSVNDNYGHDTGDEVLRTLSDCLQNTCRSTDTVSRWGGEEFLILTPDTDGKQALRLAEKIRLSVRNTEFHKCGTVTASFGISELHEDENFQSWFNRADAALYKAKRSGRNKSVLGRN